MNIVDSSGWLEYFADGPNAADFAEVLESSGDLIVPTLSLYEIFKVVLRQRGESEALRAIALMQEGKLIDLTSTIALHAAKLSLELKIPMADSVMLATAREYNAVLWTQDSDFEGIEGVRFIAKK
jgi:predicted nucleic acid-binding protein